MYTCDTIITARYKETDRMGIVHHSNYYVWFEVGRTEFMKYYGMNYAEMEHLGLMMPVIETRCFYKQPARYDDIVIVRTSIGELKGARVSMKYDIIKQGDESLLAHGYTVHAFTDTSLKPINVRRAFPDIYDKFVKYANKSKND
ncbi:MAG: acyl-CoA thioesterase [Xylanivirga thermophila]|jgi:acyl-CoA thioester hydrolase|uniref:acyl-CoA thioesterase n=1 Tax=Xylanivirga thermophila TaxID=2496273 RepID=UPI0039F4FF16